MIQGLSEIVLVVSDVSRAADFYEHVVGLVPARPRSPAWAWFWVGDPSSLQRLAVHTGSLLFEEHSPRPQGNRFGPTHLAFRVDRANLEALVDRLRLPGVAVHGPTRLEWMQAVSWYFFDPDGNLLEFWSPDPERTQ